MIRRCVPADISAIHSVINEAAQAYRGIIPEDCWHEPYMPVPVLSADLASGVEFWGFEESGGLLGVMGVQKVKNVHLIRHAYVRPSRQNQGVGAVLITNLLEQAPAPWLVGTWRAASWAIRFYQRHGFSLVPAKKTNQLLCAYWKIPPRQQEVSVVLALGIRDLEVIEGPDA